MPQQCDPSQVGGARASQDGHSISGGPPTPGFSLPSAACFALAVHDQVGLEAEVAVLAGDSPPVTPLAVALSALGAL